MNSESATMSTKLASELASFKRTMETFERSMEAIKRDLEWVRRGLASMQVDLASLMCGRGLREGLRRLDLYFLMSLGVQSESIGDVRCALKTLAATGTVAADQQAIADGVRESKCSWWKMFPVIAEFTRDMSSRVGAHFASSDRDVRKAVLAVLDFLKRYLLLHRFSASEVDAVVSMVQRDFDRRS